MFQIDVTFSLSCNWCFFSLSHVQKLLISAFLGGPQSPQSWISVLVPPKDPSPAWQASQQAAGGLVATEWPRFFITACNQPSDLSWCLLLLYISLSLTQIDTCHLLFLFNLQERRKLRRKKIFPGEFSHTFHGWAVACGPYQQHWQAWANHQAPPDSLPVL